MTNNNTTTSVNNTTVATSRIKEIANGFLSFIIFVLEHAIYFGFILLTTALGSYFGIKYYFIEQDTLDRELFPITAEQAKEATILVRSASDYMRQIEYTQRNKVSDYETGVSGHQQDAQ